ASDLAGRVGVNVSVPRTVGRGGGRDGCRAQGTGKTAQCAQPVQKVARVNAVAVDGVSNGRKVCVDQLMYGADQRGGRIMGRHGDSLLPASPFRRTPSGWCWQILAAQG